MVQVSDAPGVKALRTPVIQARQAFLDTLTRRLTRIPAPAYFDIPMASEEDSEYPQSLPPPSINGGDR